jgi:hypothetical protein
MSPLPGRTRPRGGGGGRPPAGDRRHPEHLLTTFSNAAAYDERTLLYQKVIHIAFLLSALAIAAVDRVMPAPRMHDMPSAPH